MNRFRRLSEVRRQEAAPLQIRVGLVALVARAVPRFAGMRTRTAALRAGGWKIARSAVFFGVPETYGSGPIQERLSIGEECHHQCRLHL